MNFFFFFEKIIFIFHYYNEKKTKYILGYLDLFIENLAWDIKDILYHN